ncbi:ArsR/SmtB family transcription factor [Chloroflexota bacterium]
MNRLVKILKILADESRLRALGLLLVRECCVCEVMQVLGISQSKASRILSSHYDAGLLTLRKEGTWSHYSLDRDNLEPQVKAILDAVSASFTENPQMITDLENLKNTVPLSKCCTTPVNTTTAPAGTA